MVEIVLPNRLQQRLADALRRAGAREIGGILMGEYLEPDRFRVADLTVQGRGGTVTAFVRVLGAALTALSRFFRNTRRQYEQFNYLGEWHSHPSFEAVPSAPDIRSMRAIACDPKVGANFLVLLIVRLAGERLEASLTVFWPDGSYEVAHLLPESAS